MSCRLTGVRLSVMHPCQTFVFVDLESTGLSGVGEKPRITEVSMVAVHRTMLRRSHHLPRVMDKLTVCVYPMRQVTPMATDLTGLTNDNLYCHKDFDGRLAMLLSGFITRLDPPVCLVAHNGNRFDFGLLQVELHRVDQTLPSGLLCVDSLQMFRHIDLAEASTVAAIHSCNPEVCTPQKQVTSPEKLTESGSSSLRKRKPDSVTRLISPHPQTAKKRLFEEKDVGLLEHAAPEVSSGDDAEQQNAADAGVENCEDDAADVNINSGSWSLDVTDSELLAADTNATSTENGTLSKTSLEKDAQNRDSASLDQPVVPVTKLVDRVGISQAVSGVIGPCNTTSGTGMSTPAKVKVMSTSILMNTPPYSPGYASRVATLNRSGSSSKKKQCYTLRELHKRVVGVYPCNSHHAEGDCLALVRIFQNAAQQACEWADCHAVLFSSIPPLYIPKARRSLSDGMFPYQI